MYAYFSFLHIFFLTMFFPLAFCYTDDRTGNWDGTGQDYGPVQILAREGCVW
jgi:hypothetical protein